MNCVAFKYDIVKGVEIVGQTEKAYRVRFDRVGKTVEEWLPKSQTMIDHEGKFRASRWILKKKQMLGMSAGW